MVNCSIVRGRQLQGKPVKHESRASASAVIVVMVMVVVVVVVVIVVAVFLIPSYFNKQFADRKSVINDAGDD